MRKPYIAGNWKMNMTIEESVNLAKAIADGVGNSTHADVAVIPQFLAVPAVAKALEGTSVQVGAQDVFYEKSGAFTGDISEAKGFVDSGDIKVIAVLAPERLPGEFADFPTAKEQGVDAIGANWRGFYAPGGMSDEAYNDWVSKIGQLYASDEWKEVMAANGLAPLDLQGEDFQNFVADSVAQIQAISKEIGIIK